MPLGAPSDDRQQGLFTKVLRSLSASDRFSVTDEFAFLEHTTLIKLCGFFFFALLHS